MRRYRFALSVLTMLAALATPLVVQQPASAEVTQLGWPYPPTVIEPDDRPRVPPACNPTNKPGPQRLFEFLNFWYGGANGGIARACDGSGSYHTEGRALDFMVPVPSAKATSIKNFMLGGDEYGNPRAFARRWGIIEIIWGNPAQIWSSDRPNEGFRPCPSCGPHGDHIHFSFSREGALKQTTWHTVLDRTRVTTAAERQSCGGRTITVKFWRYPAGAFGTLKHIRSITGWGTYDTQAELHSSPWRVFTALGPRTLLADSPVSAAHTARAQRGACAINLVDNA